MKCKAIQKELLAYLIDGRQDPLPENYRRHLQTCKACSREYQKLQGWVEQLQMPEPLQAPENFFDHLIETAMQEKRRAAITESTIAELGLSSPFSWLHRPLFSYRFGFALILIILILLPTGYFGYQTLNTVGNIEYVSGNVLLQASSTGSAQKGNILAKNVTVQTAQNAESIFHLSGGTEVLVASMSRVTVHDARTVKVDRGTTFFDIAKGKGKFEVITPDGTIQVLGTAFSVTVENNQTIVSVNEGVVQVNTGMHQQRVMPGFESQFSLDSRPDSRKSEHIKTTMLWVDGMRKKKNQDDLRTYYPSLAGPSDPSRTKK